MWPSGFRCAKKAPNQRHPTTHTSNSLNNINGSRRYRLVFYLSPYFSKFLSLWEREKVIKSHSRDHTPRKKNVILCLHWLNQEHTVSIAWRHISLGRRNKKETSSEILFDEQPIQLLRKLQRSPVIKTKNPEAKKTQKAAHLKWKLPNYSETI